MGMEISKTLLNVHAQALWHAILFVCAIHLLAGTELKGAAPANDKFINRTTITGTNVTVAGTNVGANKELGEPNHAGNIGGKSVWWTWTAPTNGDVTITTDGSMHTDGSPVDTLLAVYSGSSVTNLSIVASNDDHSVLVTSRVRFQALKGTNYQIAVDGFNDGSPGSTADSGSITLNLVFISEPILRPPNDNFTNRIVLTGPSVVTNGSNVFATREAGEPLHVDKLGDTSVWWQWTAPKATNVVVSTFGSSFDSLLAIYTGSTVSNLTLVANDDDIDPIDGILTSTVTFNSTAGQVYQIAVDGFDGASGQIALQIGPGLRPTLSSPVRLLNGGFQFTVHAPTGGFYEIDGSPDLTNWVSIGTLVMTNSSVPFIDSTVLGVDRQFYRAVQPP